MLLFWSFSIAMAPILVIMDCEQQWFGDAERRAAVGSTFAVAVVRDIMRALLWMDACAACNMLPSFRFNAMSLSL